MSKRVICITENDARRLRELINNPGALEHRAPECLESLKYELARAQVVAPEEIPPDVVTMNSTVHLVDMKTGEDETYTLVFPADADISQGRISVLAPIGTAILGYRAGDIFAWIVPEGERHLQVKEVIYQPEASGNYHL
ncbi:MAG: nucleoside diphosphate kinase regulator [Armatimonadota bacterium]|nr:nucleoside diphosphate kinase regulator [bacterium]